MVITVDPRLPLLPVEDFEYEERIEANENAETSVLIVDTDSDDIVFEYADADYASSGLLPPSNVTVISQTVKVAAGGQMAVDIVIEIDDVTGAAAYERRESS
jgi:hypothetical protein